MRYDESIKRLWKIASKFETRYALGAIYLDVERKAAVCTDRHALAVIDVDGLIEEGEESFLIPVDALRAADKLFTKRKVNFKDAKNVKVYIRKVDGSIVVSADGTQRSETFDSPNGQFPAWNEVMPGGKDVTAITLDAELLLRLAQALDGIRKVVGVTLFVRKATDAIVVASTGTCAGRSMGVLMPRRDEVQHPKPFWADMPKQAEAAKDEPAQSAPAEEPSATAAG